MADVSSTKPEWLRMVLSSMCCWDRTKALTDDDVATADVDVTVMQDGMVLKVDTFEGIHRLPSEQPHPGVWNWRHLESLPIFGVGQCNTDGVVYCLKQLRMQGFHRVVWVNMRVEPVVYLHGRSVSLKYRSSPQDNLETYEGKSGDEVNAVEATLCDECVAAAARNASSIPLLESVGLKWGENAEKPVALGGRAEVLSVVETFNGVRGIAGVPAVIDYQRVPVKDECAPSTDALDALVIIFRSHYLHEAAAAGGGAGASTSTSTSTAKAAFVCQCHMGRGRTTTAMVAFSILIKAATGWVAPDDAPPALPPADAPVGVDPGERNPKLGEFKGVLALCALLGDDAGAGDGSLGRRAKLLADECVDACSALTNLCTCIAVALAVGEKKLLEPSPDPDRPPEKRAERHFKNAADYQQRYASLIVFAAYALDVFSPRPGGEASAQSMGFGAWCTQRSAVVRALAEMLPERGAVAADDKATSGASAEKLKHERVKPKDSSAYAA